MIGLLVTFQQIAKLGFTGWSCHTGSTYYTAQFRCPWASCKRILKVSHPFRPCVAALDPT